jgi:hypothetical protein
MVQGCSLKRFLHVPQEAAGGYIDRGEYVGVIRRTLPSFLHRKAAQFGFQILGNPFATAFTAQGPRNQINPQSCLSFGAPSALRQRLHIDNMLQLARLEGKPKSVAIFVYLFISATLARSLSCCRMGPRQLLD